MQDYGPGGVLALDLSSRVGWAYGGPRASRPLCGVWELAQGDLGRMLASFENELEDAILLHRPGLLFVEAPLDLQAQKRHNIARQQFGLTALAEAAAYRHDIRYREQHVDDIRRAVLSRCRFDKREGGPKAFVMAWCRERGWHAPDDNAADACVAWQYSVRNLQPRAAP